jgi:hypothetical protein
MSIENDMIVGRKSCKATQPKLNQTAAVQRGEAARFSEILLEQMSFWVSAAAAG